MKQSSSRYLLWLLPCAASIAATACSSDAQDPPTSVGSNSLQCQPCFVGSVVSTTYGSHAGFGQASMPDVVMGAPQGAGTNAGSTHVVSLGAGGEIVLRPLFDIEDGPGDDFIVFENAFYAGGDPSKPYAEYAEVSVSEDGSNWTSFPCTTQEREHCAGGRPVLSSPDNGVSPFDAAVAGGDPFDLADVGLGRVKFVRIRDLDNAGAAPTAGFDLDALAVIHPACP